MTDQKTQETPAMGTFPAAPCSTWLRVNYGISRRKGKGIEHSQGKIRIKGNWELDDTHDKIKRIIFKRHPGWLITGYAIAPSNAKAQGAERAQP
jgi:hypothetical protein